MSSVRVVVLSVLLPAVIRNVGAAFRYCDSLSEHARCGIFHGEALAVGCFCAHGVGACREA
jgi:hypothetical protein